MKNHPFKCRQYSIIIAWLFAAMVLPGVSAGAAPGKMRGLMEERVKALEELVMLNKGQYQAGQALLDHYLSAENDLLEAKLELAPDQALRIALRRESVRKLTLMESLVAERVATGAASKADHLRARAARLEAEIALARELERPEGTE